MVVLAAVLSDAGLRRSEAAALAWGDVQRVKGGGRKLRYCGVERNRFWMEMTTASYNLVRLSKLTAVSA